MNILTLMQRECGVQCEWKTLPFYSYWSVLSYSVYLGASHFALAHFKATAAAQRSKQGALGRPAAVCVLWPFGLCTNKSWFIYA